MPRELASEQIDAHVEAFLREGDPDEVIGKRRKFTDCPTANALNTRLGVTGTHVGYGETKVSNSRAVRFSKRLVRFIRCIDWPEFVTSPDVTRREALAAWEAAADART